METVFRKGDQVFDIRFGWGKVIDDNKGGLFPIGVQFHDDDSQEVIVYTNDGKYKLDEESPLLSFTEYTLQGFSQERPINYKDYIGKWGKFWDNDLEGLQIGKLRKFDLNSKYPFGCRYGFFNNFELLTGEQIKVLNLE